MNLTLTFQLLNKPRSQVSSILILVARAFIFIAQREGSVSLALVDFRRVLLRAFRDSTCYSQPTDTR